MKREMCLAALVLVACSTASFGALVAYDGFDYTAAGISLNGLNGGVGWSSAWANSSGAGSKPLTAAEIPYAGRGLTTTAGAEGNFMGYAGPYKSTRTLATQGGSKTNDTLWVSFLFSAKNEYAYQFVKLQNNGTDVVSVGGYQTAMTLSANSQTVEGGDANITNANIVLLRLTYSTTGNDSITMWTGSNLDLTSQPSEASAKGTITYTSSDMPSFNQVQLHHGYGSNAVFDEVRVATTFEDAISGTSIPEPATMGLLGLGGLGLLTRRRRAK